MEIQEALDELRMTRETLCGHLLQRRTLAERNHQNNVLQSAFNPVIYATTVVDTLDAIDSIDAAIDILENETGDVINRAILCLKKRSKDRPRRSAEEKLH
jgi:hypothetical protein